MNMEVQAAIKLERDGYRNLPKCRDNAAYENYEVAIKRLSERLNVRPMITYITSWDEGGREAYS